MTFTCYDLDLTWTWGDRGVELDVDSWTERFDNLIGLDMQFAVRDLNSADDRLLCRLLDLLHVWWLGKYLLSRETRCHCYILEDNFTIPAHPIPSHFPCTLFRILVYPSHSIIFCYLDYMTLSAIQLFCLIIIVCTLLCCLKDSI